MSRAILPATLILIIVAAAGLNADESVYAPFPSRFRVSVGDSSVRLTWRDAAADVEAYRVYRHREEITDATFDEATLIGTVPPGEETFVDKPAAGTHHYAVLAENDAGRVFRVFIPFRNKTVKAVQVAEQAEGEGPDESTPKMMEIAARREADTVKIDVDAEPRDQDLVLFRSAEPINSMDSLARATQIARVTAAKAPVTDYPVPGIRYFYGAFPAQSLEAGNPRFEAGVTVTDTPVELPLTSPRTALPSFEPSPRSRNPLPFLRLTREFEQGRQPLAQNPLDFIVSVPLESETEAAVEAVMETLPTFEKTRPEPTVLPRDRQPADKGPERALSSIVEGAVDRRNWNEAERLLDNLLSTQLPTAVESRAHFYLGQAYYFTDRPRQAFFEFLLARESYYVATQPWIDSILSTLEW